MMKNVILAVFLLFVPMALSGCAQTELAAHVIKNVPEPVQSRSEGYFKVGNPYKISGRKYRPEETYTFEQTGIASWYGPGFHGKKTANGEIFDMYALTAAHKTLQLPSMVEVTNMENGRSIVVRVNDRGPYSKDRVIDLSKKAADTLGFIGQGTAKVKIRVLSDESRKVAAMARQGMDTRGTEIAANQKRSFSPMVRPQVDSVQYAQAPVPPVEYHAVPVRDHVVSGSVNTLQPPAVVNTGDVFVQAAAFSNINDAHALANQLGAFGDAAVYRAQVQGQIVYRVRLGPVPTRDSAAMIISQLEQNGVTRASNISPIVVGE